MVDMSGSTKGWINDAERESLVLLCEALETLGDRYAIYGFSGTTRKRCEMFRIKRFDEPYNDEVQGTHQRHPPAGLHAHGLRHPPSDQPAERSRSAHQAADHPLRRQARTTTTTTTAANTASRTRARRCIEAQRSGIHPFCITIDDEGA